MPAGTAYIPGRAFCAVHLMLVALVTPLAGQAGTSGAAAGSGAGSGMHAPLARDVVHGSDNPAARRCCPIVELRHYRLHPGGRESLIELFDREFVDPLDASGMQVIAQFRDIDDPNAFTWLRGFPDMASRAVSLKKFYYGPAWTAHKHAANATMVSSDDVRLLHPVRATRGFTIEGARPPLGSTAVPPGLVVATIYTLTPADAPGFADRFMRSAVPLLVAHGAGPVVMLETDSSRNTFPQLPVREGERAFVWLARYTDVAAHARAMAALRGDDRWETMVRPAIESAFASPALVWRLTPTARSHIVR